MIIDCQLSNEEMREAFRMNTTPSFWFKAALSNIYSIFIILAVLGGVVANIVDNARVNWNGIVILLAIAAVLIGLFLWRLTASIKKAAAKINTACNKLTLDAQGISTVSGTGATSFTPWSHYSRWKEGSLVFTIGDAKEFRTFPKSTMSDTQISEVRGMLQTQIR